VNDWLEADYQGYCRMIEEQRDHEGTLDPWSEPLDFDSWLAMQSPEYRRIHGEQWDPQERPGRPRLRRQ
jgi:hypothetical protein